MFCLKRSEEVEAIFCSGCGAKADRYIVIPVGKLNKAVKNKGFFASLFDFSFSEFVTSKIVRFLYVLAHIVVALLMLGMIISGFKKSVLAGAVTLTFSPLLYLLFVILSRIWLEMVIAISCIADGIRNAVRKE